MKGSPPTTTAELPSFSFLDDAGSRPSQDHDFLPAWSRGLSTSPKLTATSIDGTSGLPDVGGAGLEIFGADILMKDLEKGLLHADPSQPNVGNGLSPVLGPTHHLAASPLPPLDSRARSGSLGGAGGGASSSGGAFDSAFKKYQPGGAQESGPPRPAAVGRSLSLDSPAPLSIANVSAIASMSPDLQTPGSAVPHSPSLVTPKVEPSGAYAEGLPSGLERRATNVGAGAGQDTSRIQAYAKLEFPSFDIYIQKLSVTIGRRPATAAVPVASPQPADAPGMSAQLADYILGLEAPAIKQEEAAPIVDAPVKPSLKGKEKATDELVGEGQPSPAAAPPSTAVAASSLPSLPDTSASSVPPEPLASTSALATLDTPAPLTPPVDLAPPPTPVTDVDLGPIRAVSRQHARLYFEYDVGAWVIEVLGRNGVVVEGKWRAKGQKVLLTKKSKIQIAERIFYFVLPSIDAAEVEGAAKVKSKSKSRAKGKGKAKAADELSGFSELSENEAALIPLVQPNDGAPVASANLAPPPPAALSTLPPLPAFTGSVSPAQVRSPSLSLPPLASPGPSAGGAIPSPGLPPLPSHAPVTRGSTKPRPPPSKPKKRSPAPPPMAEEPDEYTLELGRQRAAMIAQILSGQVSASSGKSALVKAAAAAAIAQRRVGGKGKGTGPPPGKGLGKGKGIPARARRPSWADEPDEEEDEDDDEKDSDSSSGSSSGSDDSDDGMDIDGGNMAGGMKSVRATPAGSPAGTPAPPSAPPAGSSAYVPRKTPAKQPKKQRDLAIPEAYMPKKSPASSAAPSPAAASASPAPPTPQPPVTLPSSLLASLPGLPSILPALPPSLPSSVGSKLGASPAPSAASPAKPSPAASTPSLSLPPLPPNKARASPSPALSAAAPLPGKKPKAPKKGVAAAAASVGAASPDAPPSPALGADTDRLTTAPSKPRPSPYTPAAHPAGAPLPDAAPADDLMAKPPYTYASLIAQAVQAADGGKLTLHQVYDWVVAKWPYFKENQPGWQSSIRHNLTPQRGFVKVARRADEPGKGSFWQLDPTQLPNFDGHHFRFKKPEGAASPAPGASPALSAASPALAAAPTPAPAPPPPAAAAKPAAAASPALSASTSTQQQQPNTALSKPLPIVVGPIPASYVRPAQPPQTGLATDELTTALLKDPPIVLHEGTLILSPVIFGHLTPEQLDDLMKQPASTVLAGLQKEVVQHFKELMRKRAREKAREEKAAAKGAKAAKGSKAGGKKSSKASKAAAAASAASSTASPSNGTASPAPPPVTAPSPAPAVATKAPKSASTKRARPSDVDIDLTGGGGPSTSSAAPAAKVAKKSAAPGGGGGGSKKK
ncbi:hypothetical protein JCM6882_005571 [Rhodosporidiobolus microsporus]